MKAIVTIMRAGVAEAMICSSDASSKVLIARLSKLKGRSRIVAGSSLIVSTKTMTPATATLFLMIGKCIFRRACPCDMPKHFAESSMAGDTDCKADSMLPRAMVRKRTEQAKTIAKMLPDNTRPVVMPHDCMTLCICWSNQITGIITPMAITEPGMA